MGDMIHTKFNGSLDNSSLDYLAYVKVKCSLVSADVGGGVGVGPSLSGIIKLLDATFTDTGIREKSCANNSKVWPSITSVTPDDPNSDSVTVLVPKYVCNYLFDVLPFNGVYDLGGFNYTTSQTLTFRIEDSFVNYIPTGTKVKNLNPLTLGKFDYFDFQGKLDFYNITDITELGKNGLLKRLNFDNAVNVTGSFDNIGLSNLDYSKTYWPKTKNVSLDLVNFVNNNRSAGRTTGEINLKYIGAITVKANGVILAIPSELNNILSWTADSITFRGNPIDA